MLRAARNDLLLTCLTPDIVTIGVRTLQVPRLFEFLFIEETGVGAPVCRCEIPPWGALILNDAAHWGHCRRMRKSVISISIHVSYCSSVMPMSSTSSRVTSTIETKPTSAKDRPQRNEAPHSRSTPSCFLALPYTSGTERGSGATRSVTRRTLGRNPCKRGARMARSARSIPAEACPCTLRSRTRAAQ